MAQAYRTEHDLVGEQRVPAGAYYGVHSMRAAENFPITGRRLPREMILSLAWIKKACARANREAGVLPGEIADLSREVERLSGYRRATIEKVKNA